MAPIPLAFIALLTAWPGQVESGSAPFPGPEWHSWVAVPRKGPDAGKPVEPDSIPVAGQDDILILTKGAIETGQWTGRAPSGALQWTCTSGERREIPMAQVRGVIRPVRPSLPAIPLPDAMVLRNGDWLPVRVLSLANQTVTVSTSGTDKWVVPREEVAALHLRSNSAPGIVDGSLLWSRWLAQVPVANPSIIATYLDGTYSLAFAKNSGIRALNFQRDVGFLPPNFEIKAAISTTGEQLSYQFRIPGFTFQPAPEGIRVIYSQLMARAGMRGRGVMTGRAMFNWPAGFDRQTRTHAYQIFVDRNSRNMSFLVNGHIIGKVEGKEELGQITESIITVLINGSPGLKVSISDIWIAPWGMDFPGAIPPSMEQILLANGDVAQGKLQGLNDKSLIFDFEGDAIEIPRDRIRHIRFPVESVSPKCGRLRLRDGGCISVSKWRVKEGNVIIATTEVGACEISFPLDSVAEFSNPLSVPLPNSP